MKKLENLINTINEKMDDYYEEFKNEILEHVCRSNYEVDLIVEYDKDFNFVDMYVNSYSKAYNTYGNSNEIAIASFETSNDCDELWDTIVYEWKKEHCELKESDFESEDEYIEYLEEQDYDSDEVEKQYKETFFDTLNAFEMSYVDWENDLTNRYQYKKECEKYL